MTKVILEDVSNLSGAELSAIGTINANSQAIEIAFENTISRDGSTPNQMLADLDLNSRALLNVGRINNKTINDLTASTVINRVNLTSTNPNALVGTPEQDVALTGFDHYTITPTANNTDVITVDLGTGTKPLRSVTGINAVPNTIVEGRPFMFVDNGSEFLIIAGFTSADADLNNLQNQVDQIEQDLQNLSVSPAFSVTNPTEEGDLYFNGVSGVGWFSDFDTDVGAKRTFIFNNSVLNSGEVGSIREGYSFQTVSTDATAYGDTERRSIVNSVRILANTDLDPSTGNFRRIESDLVGLDVTSVGAVGGSTLFAQLRGTSGIATNAINYHNGVISNEFAAQNPESSIEQSVSMAAVQAILRPHKGGQDATHKARSLLASNDQGFEASAAIEIISAAHGDALTNNRDGSFLNVIDMSGSTANGAAIKLPRNGNGAGLIDLADGPGGNFLNYIGAVGRLDLIVAGNPAFSVNSTGITIGGFAGTTAALTLPESDATRGSILMQSSGNVPAIRPDGLIYRIGAQLFLQDGVNLKSVTFV